MTIWVRLTILICPEPPEATTGENSQLRKKERKKGPWSSGICALPRLLVARALWYLHIEGYNRKNKKENESEN